MSHTDTAFGVFLGQLKGGATLNELSEKMQELAELLQDEAVLRATTVRGKLVFTLDLAVEPNGVAEIVPTIDTKAPKPKREKSVAWVTPKGGRLVFEPPRQTKLPLQEVPAPAPAREIPSTKSEAREA